MPMSTESYAAEKAVIVIPCYNAGDRLCRVVRDVLEFKECVIVVDDGSTDGCTDCLGDFPVRSISFPVNRGKGHALIAGIREALSLRDTQAIVLMDADGQHDPNDIASLLACLETAGADLVVGARKLDKRLMPLRSRFGNVVTAWVASHIFCCPLADTQCGFRALSRTFAEAFVAQVPGGRYETEMQMILFALREGYRMASIPVSTVYEPGNRSSHFRKVRDSLRIYGALLHALWPKKSAGRRGVTGR